jgi:hypothetical protein
MPPADVIEVSYRIAVDFRIPRAKRRKIRYTLGMAKRASQDIKNKKSRSRKTAKRLVAKRAMLAAKGVRRGSVKFRKKRA